MILRPVRLALLVLVLSVGLASASRAERYLVQYDLGRKADVLAWLGPQIVTHHEFDDIGVLAVSMPAWMAALLETVDGVNRVVSSRDKDIFYLECESKCSYDTAGGSNGGTLSGGNLLVSLGSPDAFDDRTAKARDGAPGVVILTPILLDSAPGQTQQVLTVHVFDGDHRPVSGAPVQLRARTVGGETSFEGTTGAEGQAVFTRVLPAEDVQYQAITGGGVSNGVRVRTTP